MSNGKGFTWYGFIIASLIVLIPIWLFGAKLLSFKFKLIFTVAGMVAVWYTVSYGGAKRGAFAK